MSFQTCGMWKIKIWEHLFNVKTFGRVRNLRVVIAFNKMSYSEGLTQNNEIHSWF